MIKLWLDGANQKSFEMWCWGKTEISWANHLKNEEVLQRVKVERNILNKIKWIKVKWIGLMLRRNCFSKHVTEGKIGERIDVRGRRRRRSRKLLDDHKERSGYWKLKQEAVNRSLWRRRFERGYGPVVRDYVITTMKMMVVMIMMVTRSYSRRTINKQCLVREITSQSVSYGICILS